MPVAIKTRSDQERGVKIKYTPVANEYRGYPLDVSVIGDGKRTSAVLYPGVWTKVSVACAKAALQQVKKAQRKRMVPDGTGMEARMASNSFTHEEEGFRSNMREDTYDPPFEIQVDGNLD